MIAGFIAVLFIAAVIGTGVFRLHRSRQSWLGAAEELGVPYHRGSRVPLRVTLEGVTAEVQLPEQTVGYDVRASANIPADIRMSRRDGPVRDLRPSDRVTGDTLLDRSGHFSGHLPFVMAALDESARAKLGSAFTTYQRVDIADGTVALGFGSTPSQAAIVASLRDAAGLARALEYDAPSVAARIAELARTDPVPGVRRRNLAVLADYEAGTDLAIETLRASLQDPAPEVRLTAASELVPEGDETLIELAADAEMLPLLRLDALEALDKRSSGAIAQLQPLLSGGDAVALATARLLAHRGLEVPSEWLDERATSTDEVTLMTFCDVVASLRLEDREAQVTALLAQRSVPVRIAAADALATIGSIAAVEPLLEFTEGVLLDDRLKSAARGAVEAIQTRAGGGARGGLSVSGPPEADGALALAADQDGQLAVLVDESHDG